MQNHQIKIQHIRLKELHHFASNILRQPGFEKVTPISLLRAVAQEKNPFAHPDDVLLLVAYEGNRCIGYHGLLPGRLQKNGHLFKVHWATTFFVAAEYRRKGIGKQLLNEIKKLNLDVIVTGMTKDAERAYQRMSFKPLGDVTFYQLNMENLKWFEPATRAFGHLLGKCCKKLLYQMLLHRLAKGKNDIECREVDQLTYDSRPRAVPTEKYAKFYRNLEVINWMIHYPWVQSSKDLEEKTDHYHFSQQRDLFKYKALEIYSRNHRLRKGYLVFSVSRYKGKTALKILDFYFHHPHDQQFVAVIAVKYAARFLPDRIDMPQSQFNLLQRQSFLKPLLKKQKRFYLFYPRHQKSPLAASANNMMLDYCDGDVAFT